MKLLCHPLLYQRTHATVDNITCYQNEVRVLCINHIHPTSQFLARIVIPQMQVAQHHHLIRPR